MYIKRTDSTNNLMKQMLCQNNNLAEGFTIYTDFQTAGRGQQGNGWESEEGRNLLFTTLFRLHDIRIEEQFLLSELVPLALVEVLDKYADEISIKWPNDIYWKDKKLVGILIEHCIIGERLDYSIAGIGINVNQEEFKSKAPNPISLKQITGKEIDRERLLQETLDKFAELRPLLHHPEELKMRYMQRLYRRNGMYLYKENKCDSHPMNIQTTATPDAFLASISDVLPDGRLQLRTATGEVHTYHFKEVKYVIC